MKISRDRDRELLHLNRPAVYEKVATKPLGTNCRLRSSKWVTENSPSVSNRELQSNGGSLFIKTSIVVG